MRKSRIISAAEWTALAALALLYLYLTYFAHGSATATEAHRKSERTFHYGPSDVVRTVEFDGASVMLGTYKDRWFSANMVKHYRGRWVAGGGAGGVPIQADRPLSYSWSGSRVRDDLFLYQFYGYASDPEIAEVELAVETPQGTETLTQAVDDRMFLFLWNDIETPYRVTSLRGMDASGHVLYEEALS